MTLRQTLQDACQKMPKGLRGNTALMTQFLEAITGKIALVMEDAVPGRFNVTFWHKRDENGRVKGTINNLNNRSGYFYCD